MMNWRVPRRAFARAVLGGILATALIGAAAAAAPASAAPLTISGSMEGALKIHAGDVVHVGYDFNVAGGAAANTVTFSGGAVTINGTCSNGQASTLGTIALPAYTQTVAAGDHGWYPSGEQSSSAVWQASVTAPANLCGGGGAYLDASKGATFTSNVAATSSAAIHVRFHYRTNGSGSWSSTASVTPTGSQTGAALALTVGEHINGGFVAGPISGQAGDKVQYKMTVTNNGAVAVTVNLAAGGCSDVSPGGPKSIPAHASATFTCSHVLAGANGSSFTNTVSVSGTAAGGAAVSAGPVSAVATIASSSTPSTSAGLAVSVFERIKGTFVVGPISGNVGDRVEYRIVVMNNGGLPVALTQVAAGCTLHGHVKDMLVLKPHEKLMLTCWHVLTSANAPSFTNGVSVTGTTPAGAQVSAGQVNAVVTVAQPAAPTPGLAMWVLERVKGHFYSGTIVGKVGKKVEYQVLVVNTGNVALTLTPTATGCSFSPGHLHTLKPHELIVLKCSHELTETNAPSFSNTITVTGTTATGAQVSATPVTVVVTVLQSGQVTPSTPAIAVLLLERIKGGEWVVGPIAGHIGDTIEFRVVVVNTGGVPLTLSTSLSGCKLSPSGERTLGVKAIVVYTGSYVLTAANAPTFTNTATVTGTAAGGTQVSVAPVSAVVTVGQTGQSSGETQGSTGSTSAGTVTKTPAATTAPSAATAKNTAAAKQVKRVTKRSRPAKAVVRAARFTG